MKLTRERKIVVSVLGLALAAFAIDRISGGGSTGAANASDSVATTPTDPSTLLLASTSTAASPDKVVATLSSSETLAKRFAAAAKDLAGNDSAARDLFRAPATWSHEVEINSAEAARAAADQFVRSHRLGAVARNTGGAVAIVEGKLLHVGNTLDGFMLASIAADAAVFQNPAGAQARLMLNAEAVR